MRLEYFHNAIGLPRGSWRAPAHNVNGFVVQSFLDELAHETDQDPLQFRLDVLGEARELEYGNHGGPTFNPGRLSRLLKFVAERIGYGKSLPKGRGIGSAMPAISLSNVLWQRSTVAWLCTPMQLRLNWRAARSTA
jgi:isoquinoline 1-oxidoreductase beta subunit